MFGEFLLCLVCDRHPSDSHKDALETDGLVRRICCILATASLWAGNAVQRTAGEEYLIAVLQVRTVVLKLLRGLE